MATQKIGFWHAIRDMVIAAMNTGQLPALGLLAIVLVILVRMPQQEVGSLMFSLVNSHGVLGWIVAIAVLIGCSIHSRYQRKVHTNEMTRIGNEKSALQAELLGMKAISSAKPPNTDKPPKK